jgi:uncharacterized protein
MNEHLKKLIELAQVDKEIDSFGPKEAKLKDGLSKLEEKASNISGETATLEEEIKEMGFRKNKIDTTLKELSTKLTDIAKKSNNAKNEREVKSLQIEEEIAREQIGQANEEIDRLDKLEAAKKEKIVKLKVELESVKGEAKSAGAELKGELEGLEKEKKEVYGKKEKLQHDINPKINMFYQKVKRWAGNTTVVPVTNKACMGCYTVVSEEIYRNTIKSEEITTCANCGRILFMPEQLV